MSTIETNPALLAPGVAGASAPPRMPANGAPVAGGLSFADVLADRTSAVQAPSFSKHALDRLSRRGIQVDAQTLSRLTDGLQRAAGKGSRNSVIFVDGTAFVASVQNNTVITAVAPEHMREQVFTNIDSAVIA